MLSQITIPALDAGSIAAIVAVILLILQMFGITKPPAPVDPNVPPAPVPPVPTPTPAPTPATSIAELMQSLLADGKLDASDIAAVVKFIAERVQNRGAK